MMTVVSIMTVSLSLSFVIFKKCERSTNKPFVNISKVCQEHYPEKQYNSENHVSEKKENRELNVP